MPIVWNEFGWEIYFWVNENGEPIHFHISKGKRHKNDPKFWLYSNGVIKYSNNNRKISNKTITNLESLQNDMVFRNRLIMLWISYGNELRFYQ